jgi:hypothetical protein
MLILFLMVTFILPYVYINVIEAHSENTETQVIYNFANDVNTKNYKKALKSLTDYQAGGFAMQGNAPLRNIEYMEVLKLTDKTKDWQPELSLNLKTPYSYKIYYTEIEFKVNNIIAELSAVQKE